ncbi:unnamed protein product [Notodromas monacha]|uniref:Fringe-like glycosyltransferase domain-containing protein n=1 Tax=Notodromas monacha TaxID=399045 RepID=A0A7R9BI35_9CRUS|nr:unnamed protein product [Notodromas monacha]CAG0915904.1 unnamed protein product [Notodromas monacha]
MMSPAGSKVDSILACFLAPRGPWLLWFCHFDDDNYVNVPKLVKLLGRYDPQENVYLGKPSIPAPLEIPGKDPSSKKISFWFATGGAGFCISRSLALKMMPIASGGKFISIGDRIRLPDDVTMGYIIEHLLGQDLTVIKGFHSHLEPMKSISAEELPEQITFSYSKYWFEMNVLPLDGFDLESDPTRVTAKTTGRLGFFWVYKMRLPN